MDRALVVDLLKNGILCSPRKKYRIWMSRCFEISVRSGRMVEVNEYEGYAEENGAKSRRLEISDPKAPEKMYHVGRSVILPKSGKVIEERGNGSKINPAKANGRNGSH